MSRDLWLPGVTRVPGNNGLRAGAGGGHGLSFFTWHSFEAPYTFSPDCIAAARYLNVKASTATFCLHPITGAIAQLLPANQAARTLRVTDPKTGEFADVNRYGRVHMQVEVIAYARRPFTLDLTRAGLDGLTRLMNFLRSWGIQDQWAWPAQPPPLYPSGSVRRRLPEQSGHAYHSGWPVNDHGDPGAIAAPWLLVGTVLPNPDLYGFDADHWRWVQSSLAALAYYTEGKVDGIPGPITLDALRRYQRDRKLTRDGLPGPATTTALEADMATLDDIATVTLRDAAADTLGIAPGPRPIGWVLEQIIRNTVQARRLSAQAAAKSGKIDPVAVADALRADVIAAVRDAGGGATADEVVDKLVERLTATDQEG